MAGDYLGIAEIETGKLCTLCRNELVAGAVESVAADAVFLIILVRESIHIGVGRHRLMECSVEDGHLRN